MIYRTPYDANIAWKKLMSGDLTKYPSPDLFIDYAMKWLAETGLTVRHAGASSVNFSLGLKPEIVRCERTYIITSPRHKGIEVCMQLIADSEECVITATGSDTIITSAFDPITMSTMLLNSDIYMRGMITDVWSMFRTIYGNELLTPLERASTLLVEALRANPIVLATYTPHIEAVERLLKQSASEKIKTR